MLNEEKRQKQNKNSLMVFKGKQVFEMSGCNTNLCLGNMNRTRNKQHTAKQSNLRILNGGQASEMPLRYKGSVNDSYAVAIWHNRL